MFEPDKLLKKVGVDDDTRALLAATMQLAREVACQEKLIGEAEKEYDRAVAALGEAEKEYDRAVAAGVARIRELQARCSHLVSTHYPDDSETICDICGASL